MKKKLVVFALVAAMCGCMLTGCGKEDAAGGDGGSESVGETSAVAVADEEEVAEFSGDYTQEEKWGYTPFFLKYGFRNAEKKDLSDVVVFDCAQQGKTLEEVLRSEGFVSYELDGQNAELETTNIDDIINYDSTWTMSGHSRAEINMYREDGTYVEVAVYNITTEPMTMAECIAASQFYVGDNSDISDEYSGRNAFDLGDEYSIAYLEQLVEMLGKLDSLHQQTNIIMNTDRKDEEESFAETVQKGGGILSYDLIYQMEGSKLFVSISEYNMYGDYSVEYISVCYCTDDLYVYLRDETNSGALVQEEDVYPFE